ncbi:hypothetical protein [Streptomyces albipurpureus]|uniref:PE-PGRS family protein n=1 Tax=Streptomyces albipurpureus TaxID=2897419 RepID=A0ABT0UNX2_9ACTN|nr:hypothetical protein [Streptomyces sp. CWNU-1]MCM2390164.1 hypothetical protein [Streptomyces sp. CWNU-1]
MTDLPKHPRQAELDTITAALTTLAPGHPTVRIWGRGEWATANDSASGNTWAADPEDIAAHICAALQGSPRHRTTPPPARPWFESLTDSVEALRETAGEWQLAHRAALLTQETVCFTRRQLHEGQTVRVRGDLHERAWDHTRTSQPHGKAISALSRLYADQARRLEREYEDAALLYASGVAWAIRQVQTGAQPAHVQFDADGDGDPVPHGRLEVTGIDQLSTAPRIKAAHDAVAHRQIAAEHAEELAGREYVSDHEASEYHEAVAASAGMSDAAYAYGQAAEGALRWVLLQPREVYARERAAAEAVR